MAADSGAILGAGGWTTESPHKPELAGTGHIRHVATLPEATRRGLARAILHHAVAEARAAGLTRFVAMSTRTAVPFYAAMGFREERDEEVALRPGISFPVVRMCRDL